MPNLLHDTESFSPPTYVRYMYPQVKLGKLELKLLQKIYFSKLGINSFVYISVMDHRVKLSSFPDTYINAVYVTVSIINITTYYEKLVLLDE